MTLANKTSHLMASGILGLSVVFLSSAGCSSAHNDQLASNASPLPANDTGVKTPAEPKATLESKMQEMYSVMKLLGQMHVDGENANDGRKIMVDALNGMAHGLDPHSQYITGEEMKKMKEDGTGKFGGLGIELSQDGKIIKVVTPMDDSPASRAGIQPGDVISKINGESAYDIGIDAAAGKMRGTPGTPVTLTLIRKGVEQPVTVNLVREIIKTLPVKSAVINGNIGYVRLSTFMYEKSDDQGKVMRNPLTGEPLEHGGTLVKKALLDLKNQMGPNAKGYILDLRNNPGGYTYQAKDIADHFLDANKVVYTMRGRMQGTNETFQTEVAGDLIDGKQLIVLVNEGSASASELVSGALQDHGRAKIMGTTTFGKGTVQQISPLSNGDFLKVTIARYFTPLDTSIQGNGVNVDTKFVPLEKDESAANRIREADLSHSIDKGKPSPHKTVAHCSPAAKDTAATGLPSILVNPLSGKPDEMALCAVENILGVSSRTITTPVPGLK